MENVFLTEEERQKIIGAIQNKLSFDQTIINLFKVQFIEGGSRGMVLTTKSIYLYDGTALKRTIPAIQIQNLTLSLNGIMVAIHTLTGSIKFSCFELAKLIKNLLSLREKNRYEPTCELYLGNEKMFQPEEKSSFWSKMLKRHAKKPQAQVLREILNVQSSTCVLEISRKIHSFDCKTQILYLSGQIGFVFRPQDYRYQISRNNTQLYFQQHIRLKKRRMPKRQNLRQMLQRTKRTDYTQQIHFIFQTDKQFQIISSQIEGQQTTQQLIEREYQMQEKDIKSLAYRLLSLLQRTSQILSSLSPQWISLTREGFKIAEPFCLLQSNMDYSSPWQLVKQETDIKVINQWRVGMVLYEVAYHCLPFPLQYVALCAKTGSSPKLVFPHRRYPQLEHFLQVLIKGQSNVQQHKWIIK